MPSLTDFEICINPSVDCFNKILDNIIRDEGWSYCRTDYETWMTTHSKYWLLIARDKGTDVPVACLALALDEHSSIQEPLFLIGMYYCQPEYRGIGLASKVFDAAMSIPPKGSNIALNGVIKMSDKYKNKYGFDKIGLTLLFTELKCKDIQIVTLPAGITTKAISDVDWSELQAFEKTISQRPHPKFMKKWITNLKTHTRVKDNSIGDRTRANYPHQGPIRVRKGLHMTPTEKLSDFVAFARICVVTWPVHHSMLRIRMLRQFFYRIYWLHWI